MTAQKIPSPREPGSRTARLEREVSQVSERREPGSRSDRPGAGGGEVAGSREPGSRRSALEANTALALLKAKKLLHDLGQTRADPMVVRLEAGRNLGILKRQGVHKPEGLSWVRWVDANLPISGRYANTLIRASEAHERGETGNSLHDLAGHKHGETSIQTVVERILTDVDFVDALTDDQTALDIILTVNDAKKAKRRRPPGRADIITDIRRSARHVVMGARRVEKALVNHANGKLAFHDDDAARLDKVIQEEWTPAVDRMEAVLPVLLTTMRGTS